MTRGRGKAAKGSHWAGHPALFWRGDCVTLDTHAGVWRVYGPAGFAGNYWLEPVEKIAVAIALRMPYGMLESDDSKMTRWTPAPTEGATK